LPILFSLLIDKSQFEIIRCYKNCTNDPTFTDQDGLFVFFKTIQYTSKIIFYGKGIYFLYNPR